MMKFLVNHQLYWQMSSARSTYVPHAKHLHLHIKYKQDLRMYHMVSTGTESDKVSLIMPFLIFVYCCCSFLVCSVVSKDMIGLSTKIFFFIMSMYTKEQSWVNVTL